MQSKWWIVGFKHNSKLGAWMFGKVRDSVRAEAVGMFRNKISRLFRDLRKAAEDQSRWESATRYDRISENCAGWIAKKIHQRTFSLEHCEGLINAVNYAKQRRKMWMGHWFQPLKAPRRSEKYCWQSLQPWTQHKSLWSVTSFHWRWHVKCTWPHRPVWLRKTCGCLFAHEAQPQAVDRLTGRLPPG